ncbi:uncharacterized protein EV420DRAFT_1119325 [Desarmillaria tabescens]|uniref:Uncharacterized protein n=1 Tax=Armillaria tabescens TaxID=1929756 RepID=A0AA39NE75_ARMTA|nr:uncharacterized protein EV420DRAFT_1119325 [Desarmillaria tabescens]KAK0463997.1 hypothetical protein EV420DRAFT_1119325 [Desarmillaria tabescens]
MRSQPPTGASPGVSTVSPVISSPCLSFSRTISPWWSQWERLSLSLNHQVRSVFLVVFPLAYVSLSSNRQSFRVFSTHPGQYSSYLRHGQFGLADGLIHEHLLRLQTHVQYCLPPSAHTRGGWFLKLDLCQKGDFLVNSYDRSDTRRPISTVQIHYCRDFPAFRPLHSNDH